MCPHYTDVLQVWAMCLPLVGLGPGLTAVGGVAASQLFAMSAVLEVPDLEGRWPR